MKLKSILGTLILFFFIFNGCEEITETEPRTAVPADQMITDAKSAESVMNGVYSALQADAATTVYGGYARMSDGVYADNADHTGSYPDIAALWSNDVISSNAFINDFWNGHFLVIYRANKLIDNLDELSEDQIDPDVKISYVAEARFLRALMYYRLANYFGPVPWIDESLKGDLSNKDHPRTPLSELQNNIADDIQFAENNITDMGAPFRASMDAVMALKAKFNLWIEDYTTALSAAKHFEYSGTSPIGELHDSYAGLWNETVTSEDIFKIRYSSKDNNNLAWFLNTAGRGEVLASTSLLNAFEANDARMNLIASDGSFLKWDDATGGADEPYIFRLGDLYLVLAEAYARNGNYTDAERYVNYVRQRAGLSPITVDGSNWEDVILQERRVELYIEGHRWIDIKRFGVADDIISAKSSVSFGSIENKYKRWPIPQNEIDANEEINPEDQNSGY